MKCFTLIKGAQVHLEGSRKVIPKEEMSTLLEAKEIVEIAKKEAELFREELKKEAEEHKRAMSEKGFEEGLKRWNEQLNALESEMSKVRSDLEKSIVPLAIAAIRKILGREIELVPETIVDVIATSMKSVGQHRRIAIYVRKADLDIVEKERPRLKALFENLQSLTIGTRDDIAPGGCIIETEKGILNVSLEGQLKALESAFKVFLKNNKEKSTTSVKLASSTAVSPTEENPQEEAKPKRKTRSKKQKEQEDEL